MWPTIASRRWIPALPPRYAILTVVSVAVTLFTVVANIALLAAGRHISGVGTAHESISLSCLALASFRGVAVQQLQPHMPAASYDTVYDKDQQQVLTTHAEDSISSSISNVNPQWRPRRRLNNTVTFAVRIAVFPRSISWVYPDAPLSSVRTGTLLPASSGSSSSRLLLRPRLDLINIAKTIGLPPSEWDCGMQGINDNNNNNNNNSDNNEKHQLSNATHNGIRKCTNPFFQSWTQPPLVEKALPLGIGIGCLELAVVLGIASLLMESIILWRPDLLLHHQGPTASYFSDDYIARPRVVRSCSGSGGRLQQVLVVSHDSQESESRLALQKQWTPLRIALSSLLAMAIGLGHYNTSLVTAQLLSMLRLVDASMIPELSLHVHGWGYVALLSTSFGLSLGVVMGWAYVILFETKMDNIAEDEAIIDERRQADGESNSDEGYHSTRYRCYSDGYQYIDRYGCPSAYDSERQRYLGFHSERRRGYSGYSSKRRLYPELNSDPREPAASPPRTLRKNDEAPFLRYKYGTGVGLGIWTNSTQAVVRAFSQPAFVSRPLSPESLIVPRWEDDEGIDGDENEEPVQDRRLGRTGCLQTGKRGRRIQETR